MNNYTIEDLSKFRLEQAAECLHLAEIALKHESLKGSLNRSYYCIFHSMRAVLAFENFDSKKHSGVISAFRQRFVKTGKLATYLSDIIEDAFTIRNDSDYQDFYIVSKPDAIQQVENARGFLKAVEDYIQRGIFMIREANSSDFKAIAALEKQVSGIHFNARPDIFLKEPFNGDSVKAQKYFEECLQNECEKIFVYEENGDILGFCKTNAWDYEDHPVYKDVIVLNIDNICVDEKARGKGVGRHLFNKVKSYAKEAGAARLELVVSDFNKSAREFYEHLGMSVKTTCMELLI